MSIMYCDICDKRVDTDYDSEHFEHVVNAEEGIEYTSSTKKDVVAWINEQEDKDYYDITKMTKAELAALPEV